MARPGAAGHGWARLGRAGIMVSELGVARHGRARPGAARSGRAGRGRAGILILELGWAGYGWVRQGEARHGKAGQGKMRKEFSKQVKAQAFLRSNGQCEQCGAKLFAGNRSYEYDHTKEDFFGGEPTLENCKVLCRSCHNTKTQAAAPVIAKTRRQAEKDQGIKAPSRHPIPGSRASRWKRKLNGTTVLR